MSSSHDPNEPTEQKWHYEYKPPPPKSGFNPALLLWDWVRHAFSYAAFTVLPLVLFIVLDWVLFLSFKNTYYDEPWMIPLALVASVFFAGVIARQLMEEYLRSMGLFVAGILGFCTFAVIVYADVTNTGAVFSVAYMPKMLRLIILPYIYASPLVGMIGMLFYRLFSFKP